MEKKPYQPSKSECAYYLAEAVEEFLALSKLPTLYNHPAITKMIEAVDQWRANAPVPPKARRKYFGGNKK